MLFEDKLYESIALLKTLYCLFSLLIIYMLYNRYGPQFLFVVVSEEWSVKVFNWFSLKERKYKVIVVLYKCRTMSWKHWQTRQFCHNVLYNQRGLFSFAKSQSPNYILFFILVLDQREKYLPLGFSRKQRIMLKINRLQISLFYPLF